MLRYECKKCGAEIRSYKIEYECPSCQQNALMPIFGDTKIPESVFTDGQLNEATICILDRAKQVFEDCGKQYGPVKPNFEMIAKFWSTYLENKAKENRFDIKEITKISAKDVGLMMILLKLAREMSNPSRQNREYFCGYVKCVDEIESK